LLDALNPGASAAEIEAVEQAIGQALPSDVRESFAVHNGASERFVLGDHLLSTQSVITEWQNWRGLECYNEDFRETMESFPPDAVALDYANAGWVPLAQSGGSDYLGVDLAPGTAGMVGQVINFGRDEHHKCVLASNWAEFLADFATFLESGAVSVIDPDPSIWSEVCSAALEHTHCHDVLRAWRKDGRWPLRNPAT
jgi:cell wall assembly regulator SMI1